MFPTHTKHTIRMMIEVTVIVSAIAIDGVAQVESIVVKN